MSERTSSLDRLTPRLADASPARARLAIVVLSVAACAVLLLLVYGIDRPDGDDGGPWSAVPFLNAALNAAAATALVVGWRAIRRGAVAAHRRAMLVAVGFSAAFLVGYLTYHAVHGDTPFGGDGAVRALYLVVLASHVALSIVALPLILTTLWASLSGRFSVHRRIARVTFPIWLYVSVTGVVVVALLKGWG